MKVTSGMRSAAEAARAEIALPDGYKLIHTAIILKEGWELDNRLWIIDGPEGRFSVNTNHGGLRIPSDEDLDETISEHENALASLLVARDLLRSPVSDDH